jgi:hypothetical protein
MSIAKLHYKACLSKEERVLLTKAFIDGTDGTLNVPAVSSFSHIA